MSASRIERRSFSSHSPHTKSPLVNSAEDFRRRSSSRRTNASSSSLARPILTSRPVSLWTHEPPNFSTHDLVLNPDLIAAVGGVSESTELFEVRLPDSTNNQFGTVDIAESKDGEGLASTPGQSKGRNGTTKRRKQKGLLRKSFLFKAGQAVGDMPCIERSASQLQLSISRNIASVFGFYNRCEVILSKVSRADHTISHVELYFRDQYVGRADMWRLVSLLEDTCVHVGQKVILANCVKATIGRIFIDEKKVMSGYIGPQTRSIFRSESSKFSIFIQMATEMWDFDEDGEIYYEKALSGFLPDLNRRWKNVPANHVISVILFARVHYDQSELHMLEEYELPLRQEERGKKRWYIDYYKVLVDLESDCDWSRVLTVLKEEFFRFRHDVLLLRRPVAGPAGAPWLEEQHADLLRRDRALLAGTLSSSHEGNVLEAVNLALNPFDEHYIDRDLNRTGLNLLVITAGTGHFDVDKQLLRLTTERLIDNGIGLDLVCLTKMPLHSVPLFHFQSEVPMPEFSTSAAFSSSQGRNSSMKKPRSIIGGASVALKSNTGEKQSPPPDPLYFDPSHSSFTGLLGSHSSHSKHSGLIDFYGIPHWVDCSFYNLQQDKPFRANQFVPRCKMHEVQMLGLMENEINDISIPRIDLKSIPGITASDWPSSINLRSYSNGGNLNAIYGSANSKHSRTSILASDKFGDLSNLDAKEQKRLLREHFDRETFRDLEILPTTHRPLMIQGGSERNISSGPQTSSPPTFRGSSYASTGSKRLDTFSTDNKMQGLLHPTDSRNQQQSQMSSAKSSNRAGKNVRTSIVTSPRLASHDEHPSGTDHLHQSQKKILPQSFSVESLTTLDSNTTDKTPSPSRAASIRSLSTIGRGRRPLEAIGKAKALVGSSQIDFDSVDESNIGKQSISRMDSPAEKNTLGLLRSDKDVTSPTRSSAKGYGRWLWGQFRGTNEKDGLNSPLITGEKAEGIASSSEASHRIRKLLQFSDANRLDRASGTSALHRTTLTKVLDTPKRGKELQEGKDAQEAVEDILPGPISIPSQNFNLASEGSHKNMASFMSDYHITAEQELYEQELEDAETKARYAQQAQVEKQTLVNPSNPRKSLKGLKTSHQIIRWQHLFPRRLNQHVVKWRSMTTPACLPLTTIYLPSEIDLQKQWQEYPYQISISSDTASFLVKRASSTHPALAVLREMASQRLAQGFQFIVPATGSSTALRHPTSTIANSNSGTEADFRLREPWDLFQPGMLASGVPIFLSMTNQIHRISYDRSTNSINVKRFVRKTDYDTTSMKYACCIWSRNLPGYQTVHSIFNYPDSGVYNWTSLDALIAGYSDDEEFGVSTKFWRTRFVVVPSEGSPPTMKGSNGEILSDEEVRLSGMDRLAELFNRARWRPKNSGSPKRGANRHNLASLIRFIPTSLDPAMSLRDADFMKSIEAAHQDDSNEIHLRRQKRLNTRAIKGLKYADLVKEMYSSNSDLKINDRIWNRIMYKESFTGADFVTWMCIEFDDVHSREEATEWGNHLLREKVIRHVHDYHGFLDGHYFYKLTTEYLAMRPNASDKGWFTTSSSSKSKSSSSIMEARLDSMTKEGTDGEKRKFPQQRKGEKLGGVARKVLLSRSMIIDVDVNQKSDRAEVALLHYDVAHNPANGFNFQIHWLGTTARFIEDTVQSWTRSMERYGLRCVEAPINQIKDVSQHNPFQSPLAISLALLPPSSSMFGGFLPSHIDPHHFFQYSLLRKFGFILDQEASDKYLSLKSEIDIHYKSRPNHFDLTQFVHRSGVAFVQVLAENDGFLWLDNRLFNSHLPHQQQHNNSTNSGKGDRAGLHQHNYKSNNNWRKGDSDNTVIGINLPLADSVRTDFINFCNNTNQLESFYREVLDSVKKAYEESEAQQDISSDSIAPL